VGAVVVIQSWPWPAEVEPGPARTDAPLTATPIVTTVPVDEAPSMVEAPLIAEAPPEPESPPLIEAPPVVLESLAPPPPPPPPSSPPVTRPAPTPTLRSPISVSPEPRTAFPNQHVPDNDKDEGRGGLLGRLGL